MKKTLAFILACAMLFTLCACGEKEPKVESTPEPTPTENVQPSPSPELLTDDRGIAGMKASPIMLMMESSFGVPYPTVSPAFDLDYAATSCSSSGSKADDFYQGVAYDYSMSLDDDDEIVGASFGISSTGASGTTLTLAADLYFYAVSLIEYDTSDSDALSTWISDNLETVAGTDGGVSTTIGDAVFSLYGIDGDSYWIDIAKVSE